MALCKFRKLISHYISIFNIHFHVAIRIKHSCSLTQIASCAATKPSETPRRSPPPPPAQIVWINDSVEDKKRYIRAVFHN
jgi:hypothetical protein